MGEQVLHFRFGVGVQQRERALGHRKHNRFVHLLVMTSLFLGCQGDKPAELSDEAQVFWQSLQSMCGDSYEGKVVESEPPDERFDGQRLIMHVRQCSQAEIRIPFFVGDDRSRTWVFTRTASGLRLKHDHRHADGSEDAVTQYGGDTQDTGSTTSQAFHADAQTAHMIPAAKTNIWTVSVEPGRVFSYALERVGTARRFKAEFDLAQKVETPLAPWGAAESITDPH